MACCVLKADNVMDDVWEIAGETGASMGPAPLPLETLMPLVKPLVWRSQAADSFGYFLPISQDGENSSYVPDRMQMISVYRNGVRQFCGRVVSRKYIFNRTGQGWEIEAKGGWHELERVPLIADATPTYDIPQQSLSLSIRTVLERAISAGAQLQIGEIAPMMDCFPLQFRAATVAAVMQDLLRFSQDAMSVVDYETSPPTLHITRRRTAQAHQIVLGTDAVVECEVSPDDTATPDRVDLVYAIADQNGIVSQQTESAGTAEPRNRLQVVTAPTGFEDFQTRAAAAEQNVQTVTLVSSLPLSFFISRDARLAEIEATYPGMVSANLQSGPLTVSSPTWSGFRISSWTFPQSRRLVGTGAAPSLMHYIERGQWQEWMGTRLGIQSEEVQCEGTFWVAANKSAGFTAGQIELLQAMELFHENSSFWFYRYRSNVTTRAISRAYATATILRDPADYPVIPPPTGIAAFLLETMVDVPYDGRIIYDAWQPYARQSGGVINIDGGVPELLTARAQVREEIYDLATRTRTLHLGASSAGAGVELMSRFRRLSAR